MMRALLSNRLIAPPSANLHPHRKAIQLGLRGDTLAAYAKDGIISIDDILAFVHEQHQNTHDRDRLIVPSETIYPVIDLELRMRLQLSDL
jgi:uncharacterized protein YtpQ (UPF0354 family)